MTLTHQKSSATRQLILAALICMSPAWFICGLLTTPNPDFLLGNSIDLQQRLTIVLVTWGSLIVGGTLYGLRVRVLLASGHFPTLRQACAHLNLSLLVLLALPLLPLLAIQNVEVEHTWLTFTVIGITVGISMVWTYHLSGLAGSSLQRIVGWVPCRTAWLIAGASSGLYIYVISRLAILQHHALHMHSKDLGNYTNVLWNALSGAFLRTTFMRGDVHYSSHFDPILMLIAPLYALDPRAETLLIFQTVWLALGAIPVFLAARRVLGSPSWGAWASVIYLLQPALHGANLYHFHSITLVIPILCWLIYCADTKRWWPYGLLLVAMFLTREDMPVVAVFLGIYCIAAKRSKKAGLITIISSVIYLAIVKMVFMPHPGVFMPSTEESYSFAYYYEGLVADPALGARGIALSLFSNPAYLFQHVFSAAKISYLLQLLLPTLFLPFFAKKMRWLLLYGLTVALLASREPMFTVHFQYTSTILPGLLLALPVGLHVLAGRLSNRFSLSDSRIRLAIGAAVFVASVGISAKFGVLAPNDAFRAGFFRIEREMSTEAVERYQWLCGVLDRLPEEASVSATKALGAHIANRDEAYFMPDIRNADYLLIDRRRVDKKRSLNEKMREVEGQYECIDTFDGLELHRRSPET